ncbi:MAG TPA: efflux RND transporter periplasmic adaptor subunit [bacterium]|nr:efflux RND transporter periplasmic adaptor subunit [bacterium]
MARKRKILIPVGALVVLALAAFLLGKAGVIPLPGGGGQALASQDSTDAGKDKKDKDGEDEEEVVPVPVELARAETRSIAAFYRASSFVEADRQVNLVAKITGRVREVKVEEGDWVKQGDVLAELENDREEIRLRQEDLKLTEKERELTRSKSLLEQSLVTQENYDVARSAFDLAKTERDFAAVALEDTYLRAPFDGQITQRHVVPGQHINVAEPLFTLVDFTPLRVRVALPEAVARKVGAGERVQLVIEAREKPVPAVVERVSPVVDPGTSTVRITLLVDGEAELLRVGGFVKVRITTDTHADALSIPKVALVEEGALRSVFVAEEDSVRKVEITTGLWDDERIEVLDGVREGDWVVSVGQGGLRAGSRIDVLNAAEVGWVAPEKEDDEDGDEEEGAPETSDALGDDAALARSDDGGGSE